MQHFFIVCLVGAMLLVPVYKWFEPRYNEHSGITAFREECVASGGEVIIILGFSACKRP